jgi:hypothetical protein
MLRNAEIAVNVGHRLRYGDNRAIALVLNVDEVEALSL